MAGAGAAGATAAGGADGVSGRGGWGGWTIVAAEGADCTIGAATAGAAGSGRLVAGGASAFNAWTSAWARDMPVCVCAVVGGKLPAGAA